MGTALGKPAFKIRWDIWRPATHTAVSVLWQRWLTLLVLLLACVASYGLLANQLGFYWDDWFSIFAARELGPEALINGFRADRPLVGYIHAAALSWFGLNPLPWHVVALLLRWLSAVLVWWTFSAIWPGRQREVVGAAILFAVYPGFMQQSIGFIYGLNTLLPLCLFMFSLGAGLWSMHQRRYAAWLRLASVLASLASILIIEYFVGLEFFRWALIWLMLAGMPDWRRRLQRTFAIAVPYLFNVGLTTLWHLIAVDKLAPDHRQVGQFLALLAAEPFSEATRRITYFFSDLYNALIVAWWRVVPLDDLLAPAATLWPKLGLIVGVAAGVTLYFLLIGTQPHGRLRPRLTPLAWHFEAGLVGIMAVVFGQLPLWLADRHIEWTQALDRHALPAMLGAALIMVAAIEWISYSRRKAIVGVGLAAGLAAGFHFQTSDAYRADWTREKDFLWQLHWRAPGLQAGTTLLIYQEPMALPQPKDYTLALPINSMYGAPAQGMPLDYWSFVQQPPYPAYWFAVINSESHERTLRGLSFSGSAGDTLLVAYSPPGCLRVIAPQRDDVPELPAYVRAAQANSNLALITNSGGQPPPREIFGADPELGWCYYFQKADLARQMANWDQVAALGDEAQGLWLGPHDQTEWLPFLEGYLQAGRYDDAAWTARQIYTPNRVVAANVQLMFARRDALCQTLRRLASSAGLLPATASVAGDLYESSQCYSETHR